NVPGLELHFSSRFAEIAVTPPAPPPAYSTLQPGWVPSGNPQHPADAIANNPAVYNVPGTSSVNVYNATSASQLMSAAVSGNSSFPYDVVGGALFNANGTSSVDPNAVVQVSSLSPSLTGDVTIDGHTSYTNSFNGFTVVVPTPLRTGTGSITLAAAGD